jgi:biopolymer transport protein ExbB/TolQ
MKVEYNSNMEILTIMLGIFTISFAIAYAVSVSRIKKMTEAFAQVLISQAQLEAAYENYAKAKSVIDDGDVHTQNFIKFLSDSRDWAFQYIEEVQDGLKKFINEIQPQIEYYDKYGATVEGMVAPHDFALKKISAELKELKKLLPEEAPDDRC